MERIRDELFKLILSNHNERLKLLKESRMADYFCRELSEVLDKVDDSFYEYINSLPKDIASRLAYIFKGKYVKNILKNLKTDNKTISKTCILENYYDYTVTDEYSMAKLISIAGENTLDLLMLKKADTSLFENIIKKGYCCSLKELAIKGDDIISLGFKGKDIGVILNKALDYVLRNPDKNTKKELMDYLRGN